MLTKWIIAIGNTEADGVRMFYAIGNVDQIKRALVELALEDKGFLQTHRIMTLKLQTLH